MELFAFKRSHFIYVEVEERNRVDVWKPNSGTIGECTVLGGDAVEPPCQVPPLHWLVVRRGYELSILCR